jgi:hypothetical protein
MINSKNIFGWINLAFRLILSFGLIFVVNNFMGNDSVALWMVYITFIATINSIDGLLSQFFVREIITSTWGTDNKKCQISPYYNQYLLYTVLGICISFAGYFTLKINGLPLIYISFLLSLYFITRVFDSRLKAYIDPGVVQKIEILLNFSLMLIVIGAILILNNINMFIIVHLIGLIILLLIKRYIVNNSDGHKLYNSKSFNFINKFSIDHEIRKTIIISFGSSLSINVSLIAMEAMILGGISTSYLFTYRVGALICEIISIPVIIRIPELTKQIALGNSHGAKHSFMINYKQSILFCIIFMSVVFGLQGIWNRHLPVKLNLVNKVILFNILAGWLFERIATLLSQYYLSSKLYTICKYYIFYVIIIMLSVAISVLYNNEYLFSYAVLAINIILSLLIINKWRYDYAI